MIVVGGGMTGLIAGYVFPTATILEREPEPKEGAHRALLRFRSDSVSLITGIPFRKVTVRKGIWTDGRYVAPSIKLANLYALKVAGRFIDRSIWDTETVERWIAPEDFYQRMVAALGRRIFWERDALTELAPGNPKHGPIISTIPLHAAASYWLSEKYGVTSVAFSHAPISVQRWRIVDADVFQTLYFPSPKTSTYRASMTGSLLIVESMDEENSMTLDDALRAFGMEGADVEEMGAARQRYGKIAPIDERWRRELITRLTIDSGVYSAGRFATWRNILLDDVVQDLRLIKTLIESNDLYNTRLRLAEGQI